MTPGTKLGPGSGRHIMAQHEGMNCLWGWGAFFCRIIWVITFWDALAGLSLSRAPQKATLFLLFTEAGWWRRIALMKCCRLLLREQALLNTVTQTPSLPFLPVSFLRILYCQTCPESVPAWVTGISWLWGILTCPALSGLEKFISTASLCLQFLAPRGLSVS